VPLVVYRDDEEVGKRSVDYEYIAVRILISAE